MTLMFAYQKELCMTMSLHHHEKAKGETSFKYIIKYNICVCLQTMQTQVLSTFKRYWFKGSFVYDS